ncbi:hypothetical protein MPSEU_000665300 [Mayamaea pseudoterrestris]|nr:hypothetical protein MPSEU_000665300 [Mayamaea pseudoterrestris]
MPLFTFFTKTRAFKRLTKWAFKECDIKKTGRISKNDFYAGMLLVHIQLAKYAGSAACFPPTRQVCDKIFEACDEDNSETIDELEFNQCMVHIMHVVDSADDFALWLTGGGAMQRLLDVSSSFLDWSSLAKSVVSSCCFTLLIPFSFDLIDRYSRRAAEEITVAGAKRMT